MSKKESRECDALRKNKNFDGNRKRDRIQPEDYLDFCISLFLFKIERLAYVQKWKQRNQ